MSVWSFEAAEISENEDWESRPIYLTPDIKEFLTFDKSEKRIIIGLKGTGKTLFLKLISHHFRRLPGFTFIPTTQLTERLYSIDYDFSGDKVKAWASHERWKHVWRTVLSVVILKSIGHQIPENVKELFPEALALSIGGHLSAAIRSRTVNDPKFQELFPDTLDALIQKITQPVALFVDNIDESLARHAGYDLYRASIDPQSQLGAHYYGLWLAAQIGFVLAVRELSSRNSHLKLFGTVRTEAIRDNQTPTVFNVQAMVLDLAYTTDDLRGIFSAKLSQLRRTSPQSFARPQLEDPILSFFPIDFIEHKVVTDLRSAPYNEDVFEYLRRHTRGRPRELDFIGHALQMIPPMQRNAEEIRNLVRDLSYQFFQYARNEAVPYWDPQIDQLLEKIPSNFITRRRAIHITEKVTGDTTRSLSLWRSLYTNGLCGAVVKLHPNNLTQRFSNHERVAELNANDFESANIWILHPCVNIATRPRRARYIPDPKNVAGHDLPFVRSPMRKKHLHVLIGAGKLGLGLVVPKLLGDETTRVLVVVRPLEKWKVLIPTDSGQQFTIRINYITEFWQQPRIDTIRFFAVSDYQPEWISALTKALKHYRCVMFFSSSEKSKKLVVDWADSFGISVGANNIEKVIRNIAECNPNRAKIVLAYENDDQIVRRANEQFKGMGIEVKETVVDRICAEQEVNADGIQVRAELHGRITVFATQKEARLLPLAFTCRYVDGVRYEEDPYEFAFIRETKKRLVNSIHAAAAALVHEALIDAGAKITTADDKLLGLLAGNMDIHNQLLGIKELMILAVLGTLPEERLQGKQLEQLIKTLSDESNHSLRRVIGQADAPSRVLRIDPDSLANKYSRLFADVSRLALIALQHTEIKTRFPITDKQINERLFALNEAFLRLFTIINK